ncbi:MAG: flavodoxin family protein [Phycisphaerae bacterium]|nr:flavodoxin family protein [Phycisphaerae bacterium]
MAKSAVAIVGTYRKGRVIDCAVSEVLRGLEAEGVQTSMVHLLDTHIEFCTNCRACTQVPGEQRGQCVLKDDMEGILQRIDEADVVVLASPINFGTVTALMKRFIERLVCTAHWPWESHAYPKPRIKTKTKQAILVTSSACPAFMGRWLMPNSLKVLKQAADCLTAKVYKALYFGMVADTQDETLRDKDQDRAYAAGRALGASL